MNIAVAIILSMLIFGISAALLQSWLERRIERYNKREIYEDSSTEHIKIYDSKGKLIENQTI